jgi:hypothetical protein
MYILLDDFQKYSNVFGDKKLQEFYIQSAENIVENYLGYNISKQTYNILINGNGTDELQLKAKPINEIISVEINEEKININQFSTDNEFIYYKKIFPIGIRNIEIVYSAGYDTEEIPNIILTTILRIATLLQTESDSNIGVTSKYFGDSGTRTFVNNTDYSKYLLPISQYKLIRI